MDDGNLVYSRGDLMLGSTRGMVAMACTRKGELIFYKVLQGSDANQYPSSDSLESAPLQGSAQSDNR